MKQFKEIQSRLQSLVNVEVKRKESQLHHTDYVGIDSVIILGEIQFLIEQSLNNTAYHSSAGMLGINIPDKLSESSTIDRFAKRIVFDNVVKKELLIVNKTIEVLDTEIKLIEDYD